MFNIVLHEPEKPDNTANIGRTCVVTGSSLHLIYPLGFQLTRKNIHHAGLDYWERLDVHKHDNYDSFLEYIKILQGSQHEYDTNASDFCTNQLVNITKPRLWFATTKAHKTYADVEFKDGDYIMFGKESAGIPEEILASDEEHCIRIPMAENERSLNLSNSVAIILYEALRQNNFLNLQNKGELHRLQYKGNLNN